VAELEVRITAVEFGEWWALYRMEPWGEVRADIASGMIASTVANVNRSTNSKPFTPMDFAPYLKPQTDPVEIDPAAFVKGMERG